ncbi:VOC family protein [Oceanobacillus manasiensis]|uniref:VOC family protein n=1 Tax=Oceanobacillus manasiensis TaxID=586413 RepID=UPI0005A7C820|nr:VOC family protein [Oceanobacillus manasiensis]
MEKKFFNEPATYVGGLSINVTDLQQAIDFYQTVIGFQVLDKTERTARLSANGKTAMLTLEMPENVTEKERRTTGLYHFAILLPNRAALSSFLEHALKRGVQLGAADHEVSEALYLSDPDGNGIEVYSDRDSSGWNWNGDQVKMGTDPLDGDGLLAEEREVWSGLPEETILGHIHLHVANLKASETFYNQGLNFSVVTRYPGALFISTGDYHHHIGLNTWNGEGAKTPQPNRVGLNWFSLVFPNENSRTEAVNRLIEAQVKVKTYPEYSEVKDPAGNTIRLTL